MQSKFSCSEIFHLNSLCKDIFSPVQRGNCNNLSQGKMIGYRDETSELGCKIKCETFIGTKTKAHCTHYEWDSVRKKCTFYSVNNTIDDNCSWFLGVKGMHKFQVDKCLTPQGLAHLISHFTCVIIS